MKCVLIIFQWETQNTEQIAEDSKHGDQGEEYSLHHKAKGDSLFLGPLAEHDLGLVEKVSHFREDLHLVPVLLVRRGSGDWERDDLLQT